MPKSKGRRHKQKAKVSRIDQHKRTGKPPSSAKTL